MNEKRGTPGKSRKDFQEELLFFASVQRAEEKNKTETKSIAEINYPCIMSMRSKFDCVNNKLNR